MGPALAPAPRVPTARSAIRCRRAHSVPALRRVGVACRRPRAGARPEPGRRPGGVHAADGARLCEAPDRRRAPRPRDLRPGSPPAGQGNQRSTAERVPGAPHGVAVRRPVTRRRRCRPRTEARRRREGGPGRGERHPRRHGAAHRKGGRVDDGRGGGAGTPAGACPAQEPATRGPSTERGVRRVGPEGKEGPSLRSDKSVHDNTGTLLEFPRRGPCELTKDPVLVQACTDGLIQVALSLSDRTPGRALMKARSTLGVVADIIRALRHEILLIRQMVHDLNTRSRRSEEHTSELQSR